MFCFTEDMPATNRPTISDIEIRSEVEMGVLFGHLLATIITDDSTGNSYAGATVKLDDAVIFSTGLTELPPTTDRYTAKRRLRFIAANAMYRAEQEIGLVPDVKDGIALMARLLPFGDDFPAGI